MITYEILKVKDTNSNGFLNMARTINLQILSEARPSGYSLYGIFYGLYGKTYRAHQTHKGRYLCLPLV